MQMCAAQMGMTFCPTSFPVYLVFKDWVISDSDAYSRAQVYVFLMGGTRQLITQVRAALNRANRPGRTPRIAVRSAFACDALQRSPTLLTVVDALLLAAETYLGYLNMLIVMAYDAGLLSALVWGEVLGYAACSGLGRLLSPTAPAAALSDAPAAQAAGLSD